MFFFLSLSLSIPQFGFPSHNSSLRLSSGQSSLVLTLSIQLSPSCSAPVHWWWTKASGLLLCLELRLDVYSLFVCLFLPVMLTSEILKFPTDMPVRVFFLLFGNFSFMTPSPDCVSIPNSFVSLFVFYILSYLLLKRMGCLSGCLVSSTRVQKLFCGSCSAFK